MLSRDFSRREMGGPLNQLYRTAAIHLYEDRMDKII
jgi:hypothetical protein